MAELNQDPLNEKQQDTAPDIMPGLNVDDNVAGTEHMNEKMTESDELDRRDEEIREWKDKYTRLVAEFDNFKKRSFKEKMELIQTAGKDVIMSLLDVMDDLERAEKQMESATDIEAVKEGMNLVFAKLRQALQQKGLKAFESKGEEFDVEKHEAVTEIPSPSKDMEGKVLDELQKGYLLNDKLIRHARVVVGKASEE